ncbi:hypothetical protein CDAR_434461 [Caerostris darwini]|uniref:Uncharacterized protein n=1 Tax=Caerostris darwini TaxID=1538125 RepID=A0AAV4PLE0_9ARAC|nr:hypothetical protein CDAR_434461 [Caerostris darwini]
MRRGQADVETNLYSLQITSPSSEWNETAFIMDVVRARLSQSVVFLASQPCCKSFLTGERVNGNSDSVTWCLIDGITRLFRIKRLGSFLSLFRKLLAL